MVRSGVPRAHKERFNGENNVKSEILLGSQ